MSRLINKRYLLTLLLCSMALFVFGCGEEHVAVRDIYFSQNEQIVLLLGEADFDLDIVVTPTYATDSSYTLTSLDESVVKIVNGKVQAVGIGNTKIKVVSNDNKLLQDMISVAVLQQPIQLSTPTNLSYDKETEMFSFDSVTNASNYILDINGKEIDLGNSNTYSLKDYNRATGNGYGEIVEVKVKAIAPSYTRAYLSSEYSAKVGVYQMPEVSEFKVVAGRISFASIENAEFDLYINDDLLATSVASGYSLENLGEEYLGQNVKLTLKPKFSQGYQKTGGVNYCESKQVDKSLSVLPLPDIEIVDTVVRWNRIEKSNGYHVVLDGQEFDVDENNFDLKEHFNFNTFEYKVGDYNLSVTTKLSADEENVVRINKSSNVKFNRLQQVGGFEIDGHTVNWQKVAGVDVFDMRINGEDVSSTTDDSYNFASSDAGEYTISLVAVGTKIDDVYYLSSKESSFTFVKNEVVIPSIYEYHLRFDATSGDTYTIKIDQNEEIPVVATSQNFEYDLSDIEFTSGAHTIKVVHCGVSESVMNSDITATSFTQLKNITGLDITNGVLSTNSVLEIGAEVEVAYDAYVETLVRGQKTSITFNTTDITGDYYLPCGNYTATAKVLGDGSEYFSYREKVDNVMTLKETIIDFVVLETPNLTLNDHSETQITATPVLDAAEYRFCLRSGENYNQVQSGESVSYTFGLDSGEQKEFRVQALGDGTNFLNSAFSDSIIVKKLTTPSLSFNYTTLKLSLNYANEDSGRFDSFVLAQKKNDEDSLLVSYDFSNPTAFSGDALAVGDNYFAIKLLSGGEYNGINYIDSEISSVLDVKRVDATTDFEIKSDSAISNQLIITPAHGQNLNVVLRLYDNNNNYRDYISGKVSGKLVSDYETHGTTYSIDYSFKSGKYLINLTDGKYVATNAVFANDFSVQLQYSKSGSVTSDWTPRTYITHKTEKTLIRDGQNFNFATTGQNDVLSNYALLLNGQYTVINSTENSILDTENSKIVLNVDYLKNNTTIQNVNTVKVISLNTDSSSSDLKMSSVGPEARFTLQQNVTLTAEKDNNSADNSLRVKFNSIATNYAKTYTLYFADNTNTFTSIINDIDEDLDGVYDAKTYTFNLDTMAEILTLTNNFRVCAKTSAEAGVDGLYIFDSNISNPLQITRVNAPTNVNVDNSVLSFDSVSKVAGYEVYSVSGSTYTKLNTNLILSTTFDLSNVSQDSNIVVKAIGKNEGYSNSTYSSQISLVKLPAPTVSVVDGYIVVSVAEPANALKVYNAYTDDKFTVGLYCKNYLTNETKFVVIDENYEGITNSLVTIVLDPHLILNYGTTSLIEENVDFQIVVGCGDKDLTQYYLNSDVVNCTLVGLFKVENISRTTQNGGSEYEKIEFITWAKNSKNVVSNSNIETEYVVKFTYNGKDYYSTDSRLKYYNGSNLVSYGHITTASNASTVSISFPAGYDIGGDNEVLFEEGVYTINIRTLSSNSGYCGSSYSADYVIEIMSKPTISIQNGYLSWAPNENATSYILSVYDRNETLLNSVVLSYGQEEYDLSARDVGLYYVDVKAINDSDDNILNSATSDKVLVYKMPTAADAYVEDGILFVEANKFTGAIGFVFNYIENYTEKTIVKVFSNSDMPSYLQALTNAKSSWADFNASEIVSISNVGNNLLFGFDMGEILPEDTEFTLDIMLFGNSDATFPMVNSNFVNNISNLTIKTIRSSSVIEVGNGNVKIVPYEGYSSVSMQNNLGIADDFLRDAHLYELSISLNGSWYTIYSVDYKDFVDYYDKILDSDVSVDSSLQSNFVLADCDTYLTTNQVLEKGNLYGYYNYQGVYLNVYKDNIIDLNKNGIYYFNIAQTYNTITHKFDYTMASTNLTTYSLDNGGSYVIKVRMLGGDTESNVAFLNSMTATTNTFVKYEILNLASDSGKVKFKDLTKYDEDNNALDHPIYRLKVNAKEASLGISEQIIYLYTNYTEAQVISHLGLTGTETFVELSASDYTTLSGQKYVNFDLGKYLTYATEYSVSITTFAGKGRGANEQNYYINARVQNPESVFTYSLPSTTHFVTDAGKIRFELSTYKDSGLTKQIYNYEIKINAGTGWYTNFITVNAPISGNVIEYTLPETFTDAITNASLNISNGGSYLIKIRPLGNSQLVLNGNYELDGAQEKTLLFTITNGINFVSIQNGKLVWRATDSTTYNGARVRIRYLDNDIIKTVEFVPIATLDNGFYKYEFESIYNLISTGTTTITSGIDYYLSICSCGYDTATKYVDSFYTNTFKINRLARVDSSSVQTANGQITWTSVQDAVGYIVKLYNSSNVLIATYTTEVNVLQEDLSSVSSGDYYTVIKALGNDKINSIDSVRSGTLTKLGNVDTSNANIELRTFNWTQVANANAYKVVFNYDGEQNGVEFIVTENSITVPEDLNGDFTVNIQALRTGTSLYLNSNFVSYVSSYNAPRSIKSASWDGENYRIVIVTDDDFSNGDQILISYTLTTGSGHIQHNEYISYLANTTSYYYNVVTIGEYSAINVSVVRNGALASNPTAVSNFEFDVFESGSGTELDCYYIATAEQLLNIAKFSSAYFRLSESIDLATIIDFENDESESYIGGVLSTKSAIIVDNFTGVLDGNNHVIYLGNLNQAGTQRNILLSNVVQFALFGTITNAQVTNLFINESNCPLNLTNSLASNNSSVLKLSLIANEISNSVLTNVNVRKTNLVLSGTNSSATDVKIAGIANTITSTRLINCYADISVQIPASINTNNIYVASFVNTASASKIDFNNVGTNAILTVSGGASYTYVGAIVSYWSETNKSTNVGVYNADVQVYYTQSKTNKLGGLVGYAKNIYIENGSIGGNFGMSIASAINAGGIVGDARLITQSGTAVNATFNIQFNNSNDKYIGALVGSLDTANNSGSTMTDNVITITYSSGATVLGQSSITTLGEYGYIASGAIVS